MRRPDAGYHRLSRTHGVAFVYFTLFALPFIFLAAAMAVDFTRIITTSRAVTNAAQAAASAGAWQFTTGEATLDPVQAQAAALDTFCRAKNYIPEYTPGSDATLATCPDGTPVSVDIQMTDYTDNMAGTGSAGYTGIAVSADYRVPHMLFFFFFGGGHSYQGPTITQTATVCVPGDTSNYTGGYCSRPQG